MEISTDEVPTAEDKMESGENIDRNDDNGKGDASSDFAMEDSKQQMTDVMVKEESTSLAMESEEPDNEKSEQANNNGVVSMETEQEKNSDETSENVGVAASEPEELAIEIKTEPLQEEEYGKFVFLQNHRNLYTC